MRISTEHYERKHYLNGRANAFRHALWNYLIAKNCSEWSKNKGKVLEWTKNITDWHEFAFPNRKLARKMDLHNNEIGRRLFLKHEKESILDVINVLKEMTKKSIFIDSDSDLAVLENQLVHIAE